MQLGLTLRNAMVGQYETVIGTAPKLQLRSGSKPADCAAADAGSLAAELTLPSDWLTAASAGAVAKNGTWTGTAAASLVVQHYRLKDSAGSVTHEQGVCSEPWSGSKAYVLNQQVHNGGNVYRCTTPGTSASSGGPTGTGSGITDGSAVWAFVQAGTDVELDNTNINATQPVTVTGWIRTQGGA